MKKFLFIISLTLFAVGAFAQKQERKAIRSGNKAYKDQLYGAAEQEYTKAMGVNPASKEASYNLANAFYKQQKWDEALKEYNHYLTLEKENTHKMSSAWSNVGNTYLKKKANEKGQMPVMPGQQPQQPQAKQEDNLKLSMEAYKNALRLNPKDDETRYNLAVVQKMIKDKEDQQQDQNKDQNKDQKQNKDKDKKQDQQQDQNKDQQQNKDKDQKQDQKQNQQNQMSQDNIQQMLQAIEQDEKATQDKVNQAKAQERKRKNEDNRRQNKDW